MTLRLKALNLVLRLVVRPRLAATPDEAVARRDFRIASHLFPVPRGTTRRRDVGHPPLTWVNAGRGTPGQAVLYFHGGAYVAGSPDVFLGEGFPKRAVA
jgi:acetyl esterase/lipase